MENGTKFILFLNSSRSNKAVHPEIFHYIFLKVIFKHFKKAVLDAVGML